MAEAIYGRLRPTLLPGSGQAAVGFVHGRGPTSARVKEGTQMKKIRCQLFGEPAIPAVALDEKAPPPFGPGLIKSVKVQGMEGYIFECLSDAHAERDHEFPIEDRILIIPWDKFRLQRALFLEDEVSWKESVQ